MRMRTGAESLTESIGLELPVVTWNLQSDCANLKRRVGEFQVLVAETLKASKPSDWLCGEI